MIHCFQLTQQQHFMQKKIEGRWDIALLVLDEPTPIVLPLLWGWGCWLQEPPMALWQTASDPNFGLLENGLQNGRTMPLSRPICFVTSCPTTASNSSKLWGMIVQNREVWYVLFPAINLFFIDHSKFVPNLSASPHVVFGLTRLRSKKHFNCRK